MSEDLDARISTIVCKAAVISPALTYHTKIYLVLSWLLQGLPWLHITGDSGAQRPHGAQSAPSRSLLARKEPLASAT